MEIDELLERRRKYRIRVLLSILIPIILFVGIVLIFKVRTVEIEGSTFYKDSQVQEMIFTNAFEKNMLGFWLENQFLGHKDLPFVREYKITYSLPSKVHIKLYEKSIIAGAQYMNEFIYFDKEGMVLESTDKKRDDIPLFEIENIKNFSLYQTIDMGDKDLLEKILKISNLMEHYHLPVERIIINESNDAYLYAGKIQINLGSGDRYDDAMAALETVLPTALENNLEGEFDLTTYQIGDNIILKKSS